MLELRKIDITEQQIETLLILVTEDDVNLYSDNILNKLAKEAKGYNEFNGEKNEELILYPKDNIKRLSFVGIGKMSDLKTEDFRNILGQTVGKMKKIRLSNLTVAIPDTNISEIVREMYIDAMMEGAFLANYSFDKYKNEVKIKSLQKIIFIGSQKIAEKYRKLPKQIEHICSAVCKARDWVSIPSNEKTPELFSKMIIKEAEETDIRITLMEEKELRSKGFGALLAVGQGSSNSSCLMIMHYKPKKSVKKMAVVGKAVTFDSGGINLKPSDHITDMKQDMAGGATTAATIIAVAKLKLNIEMIAAIPMAENMPSGKAIKPGDIIKSYSGKTIEILNTDAEGRLILADTLAYITKTYSPDCILDLATLTGACVVALGEKIAGLYSNNEALSKNILNASTQTSEKCWEMPLPDEYKELMKSDFADIRNISTSRYGGSITAALFLSEFVEKTPWCHLDIAGPAYLSKAEAYCPPGGRGFAVRLLCRLLENYCEA